MASRTLERLTTKWRAFWRLYRLSPSQVQNYFNAFDMFKHEWSEQDYDERIRQGIRDYYFVMNQFCALGEVEKMYIPPALDLSKNIIENQELFEERMAQDLALFAEAHALELGCGRGRISAHIHRLTQAHIYGINIDPEQINEANRFALSKGLLDNLSFTVGDLNDPLPFADESLDAVYEVQALSYAKDLPSLFQEIHRVLKPSGRFACLDYALKEAYNANDPHHVALVQRTKPLLGAIGSPRVAELTRALELAGFTVLVSTDPSINGQQTALIQKARSQFGGWEKWLKRLVRWRILPAHFPKLWEPLMGGDAFVEADQLQILTTSWYITAQKH